MFEHGDLIDNEMLSGVELCFNYVMEQHKKYAPSVYKTECQVNAGQVIYREDCWGTSDIVFVTNPMLEVIDYKSGYVQVEADDPQLLLYAVGALLMYGWANAPFQEIKTTIVQPFGDHPEGPIRSRTWTPQAIMEWAEMDFRAAAAATDNPDAPANPTEEACRYCRVKGTCPELAQASLQAAQAIFPVVGESTQPNAGMDDLAAKLVRSPTELSPEERAFILDHESLITGWLAAVRQYSKELALEGREDTPGWKVVAGRRSRKWAAETEEEVAKKLRNLKKQDGKRLGKTDVYVESLISPAQAEKRIKPVVKPETWGSICKLIIVSEGNPTLVPETDSRPALITKPEQIFQPVQETPVVDLSFLE